MMLVVVAIGWSVTAFAADTFGPGTDAHGCFTVTSFGAVADSLTDSTNAFQGTLYSGQCHDTFSPAAPRMLGCATVLCTSVAHTHSPFTFPSSVSTSHIIHVGAPAAANAAAPTGGCVRVPPVPLGSGYVLTGYAALCQCPHTFSPQHPLCCLGVWLPHVHWGVAVSLSLVAHTRIHRPLPLSLLPHDDTARFLWE
jgi:hypothetical protein